ncbi:MAG: alpha/beta fold hydrolase [Mycetocola sp.]
MRTPLKATLITVGAIVALPVLLLTTTTVVNAIASRVEQSALEPYGELIPVDGKLMNVVDTGGEGDTVVLLPGLGTTAPALDFDPLITELSSTNRVIAIEPFGTGLSDQTATPRTVEHITAELHEALQVLDVDRYVLMGHSISGIYALEYSQRYAEELIAFVGIDSSVPDQPGSADPAPTDGLAALNNLGVLRALNAMGPDPYDGLPYSADAREQMRILREKNTTGPTLLNEMEQAPDNFAAVSGLTFPSTLPVLLFVVAEDPEIPDWMELHQDQAEAVETGQVIGLNGDHYLHHTRSVEIAADTRAFVSALPSR